MNTYTYTELNERIGKLSESPVPRRLLLLAIAQYQLSNTLDVSQVAKAIHNDDFEFELPSPLSLDVLVKELNKRVDEVCTWIVKDYSIAGTWMPIVNLIPTEAFTSPSTGPFIKGSALVEAFRPIRLEIFIIVLPFILLKLGQWGNYGSKE